MAIERRAIYPGSFDPTTNGHLWMMKEVSDNYDKGYISIGMNSGKQQGRFPVSERMQMLEEIKVKNNLSNLIVNSYIGLYLVDFAETLDTRIIIRGIRNGADAAYESDLAQLNTSINSRIKTIAVPSPKELLQISSSTVMGLMGFEGWGSEVAKMVPEPVFMRLEKIQFERDKKLLGDQWQRLCDRLGVNKNQSVAFEDLFKRYVEKNRRYHDVTHLKTCLNELELVRDLAEDPDALEMAILFHDAVYESNDPTIIGKKDDEGKSAQLAVDLITNQLGLGRDFADKVASLIMTTKHNVVPQSNDAKLMVDIDLAIFGRSPRLFNIYEQNVREEWNHVELLDFAKGRKGVLESFLPPKRDAIYQSAFFRERYEEQAKKNLQESINKLNLIILAGNARQSQVI